MPASPLILFPHSANTGGDSLSGVLAKKYGIYYRHFHEVLAAQQYLRGLKHSDAGTVRCIAGHGVYFGLHRFIATPCIYIGLWREPIERVLSQYYYYESTPGSWLYRQIHEDGYSLVEFATDFPNEQMKRTLGTVNNRPRDKAPEPAEYQTALEILDAWFPFVGITEHYDETVFLLKSVLGWEAHGFWHATFVNKTRPRAADLPKETIERIRADNEMDLLLYEALKARFDAQLRGLPAEVQSELETYKRKRKEFLELLEPWSGLMSHGVFEHLLGSEARKVAIICGIPELKEHLARWLQEVSWRFGSKTTFLELDVTSVKSLDDVNFTDNTVQVLKEADMVLGALPAERDWELRECLDRIGVSDEKCFHAICHPYG